MLACVSLSFLMLAPLLNLPRLIAILGFSDVSSLNLLLRHAKGMAYLDGCGKTPVVAMTLEPVSLRLRPWPNVSLLH